MNVSAWRWLIPGIMQLVFNVPMLVLGYYFEDVETCSIHYISEVLQHLGLVMTTFGLIHIILGILTHCSNENDEKGCFKFTTWAWTTVPIFSTYWVIVIATGITQFILQCLAYPVFFGNWPFEAVPSVDYNDKSKENFCEEKPFMIAYVVLAVDMIIGIIVILYTWFWKFFKWCGLCCCLCCCGCDNPNAYRLCTTFPWRQCRDEILECFFKFLAGFRKPNVRTYPVCVRMNDINDQINLIT